MIPTKTKWTTDLSNLELLNIKMTTTKVDVNPSPGLGQTLIYDVIKQVNRIQTLPLKLKYLPAKQK
jgi:hypothetical protein